MKNNHAIAIADDHPVYRDGLVYLLEQMSYEILCSASDGEELVSKITKAEYLPSLCIIDIDMSEFDGFKTTQKIKEIWPEIKVLLVSSFVSEAYMFRVVECGANGYVTKFSDHFEISRAINCILHDGHYFNDTDIKRHFWSFVANRMTLPSLSELEIEILVHVCNENTASEIAQKMKLSTKTIENQKMNLFRKFGVHSNVGLVTMAIRYGYYSIGVVPSPFYRNTNL